jgi:hypothetical protein
MKKQTLPESTPIETYERFKQTEWPAIFGRWAVIAQGSKLPQKFLFQQWQDQINGLVPLFVDGSPAYVNSEGRDLLIDMGLVQVRKLPLRDKIGFALFAPEPADYDAFASRVEFSKPGIALLSETVPATTTHALTALNPIALPESTKV